MSLKLSSKFISNSHDFFILSQLCHYELICHCYDVTTLFPCANHSPSFPAWSTSSSSQNVSEACPCMLLPLGTYLLLTCPPHHAFHSYSIHTLYYFHAYHLMLIVLTPCLLLIIYIPFTICTPCSFLTIYIHIPYAFLTPTAPFSSI